MDCVREKEFALSEDESTQENPMKKPKEQASKKKKRPLVDDFTPPHKLKKQGMLELGPPDGGHEALF
jgi:hypothetical protein